MTILDGKETAKALKLEIAQEVEQLVAKGEKRPHLVAVLVGEDGASRTYVANKEKSCMQVGFKSTLLQYPADITEQFLLDKIVELNNDSDVDGFIVQLPLPKHIDEKKVVNTIDPSKDVDGFNPVNIGRLMLGEPTFISATPFGIIALLEHYKIETAGKHCVVLGRSNIVGRPIANILSQKSYPGDCTVSLCHSRTKNIKEFTLKADIIVAAIGSPHFLKADMVKEGAVVIDVGITRVNDNSDKGYKIVGDVDFDSVAPKCSYITPVPGGVGPMTIISLMRNTLLAKQLKK
jgi:methylenetetrahydrofolate dehydrogenase (NADP+) / methenyltetrahydrofolate cyclohydrolase